MKDAMISIGARSWSFPGAQIDTDSWELEWHSDGKVYLHDDTGKVVEGIEVDNPEAAGILAVPLPEERRLKEILLARLMILVTDHIFAGEGLGLESVRDLVRELRHAYPELVDESVGV
jgi:hypothetical protein